LVAYVLVSKYAWHLPLYRQAQILLAQGIEIDRSVLAFWVGYAAAELMPLWQRMREILLGSPLCGAAGSLGELVFFRALQGIAEAGLVPLSQATLLQINPPERHGRGMAIFGMGTICGPIMGPALGGWLTYEYRWRRVFYINLPVGVPDSTGSANGAEPSA
jgi:MFS family permease